MIIKAKKLSEAAILPSQNTDGDAGYDLYSTEERLLLPFERYLFRTNIALAIPYGYYGQILDRSGNAFKKGLHVLAGVIDSTYRGDIGVLLINLNHDVFEEENSQGYFELFKGRPVEIKKGDKIAQIVFKRYFKVGFKEVKDLDETTRGEKGFGSSGD